MSSLLLLNGSPRGPRSNSMKMLARIAEGWESAGGERPEVLHLARRAEFARAVAAFGEFDVVLLGMPLYTDSMPALVKTYVEALEPRLPGPNGSAVSNPRLGFLVQSGFSEALHSRYLERYLEKLAGRLGSPYAGTIVKGGGEALQAMPDEANEKLWRRLRVLGEQLAHDGCFGREELRTIAGTERLSGFAAAFLGVALKLPVAEFYWNNQLKKEGAWEKRFAAPYAEPARR